MNQKVNLFLLEYKNYLTLVEEIENANLEKYIAIYNLNQFNKIHFMQYSQ